MIVGLEHAQAVPDRDSGGDHEKSPGEPLGAGMPDGIDGLPANDHGHDRGLAGSGSEFQRGPKDFWVGLPVDRREVIEEPLSFLSDTRRHFGEPDQRFDRFDLAEEGADSSEQMVPPVLEQAGRFRGDAPSRGVGQVPPAFHLDSQLVDQRPDVVLLSFSGEAFPFIQRDDDLAPALPPGPGDGRDEGSLAPAFGDVAGGLAVLVQLPVAAGQLIRRVQDRLVEELGVHVALDSSDSLDIGAGLESLQED